MINIHVMLIIVKNITAVAEKEKAEQCYNRAVREGLQRRKSSEERSQQMITAVTQHGYRGAGTGLLRLLSVAQLLLDTTTLITRVELVTIFTKAQMWQR